MLHQKKV
jgi:ABC-type transport system involved in cytochrome bd biosynthesis fused ATPase/permease subunit